eukprot:scaffold157539_cov14-Tisochrysis_lutea.AAC.1
MHGISIKGLHGGWLAGVVGHAGKRVQPASNLQYVDARNITSTIIATFASTWNFSMTGAQQVLFEDSKCTSTLHKPGTSKECHDDPSEARFSYQLEPRVHPPLNPATMTMRWTKCISCKPLMRLLFDKGLLSDKGLLLFDKGP